MVVPRFAPPSATNPTDPVGPPGFRAWRLVRDAVLDPGTAAPSRDCDDAHAAFTVAEQLGLCGQFISGLTTRTSHEPCVRFERCVTAPPATLGSGLLAKLCPDRHLSLHVTCSFSQRTSSS